MFPYIAGLLNTMLFTTVQTVSIAKFAGGARGGVHLDYRVVEYVRKANKPRKIPVFLIG
jgi:hypothetical protein